MKKLGFLLQFLIPVLLFSCSSQSDITRSRLTTGFYKTKKTQGTPEKRYVLIKNDTIWAYPVNPKNNQVIDSARTSVFAFPKESFKVPANTYTFNKKTWDFNFQTIISKFRPAAANVPNQLSTNFNLNLYLGRRADKYRISYKANPLELNKRKIDHFGLSFGVFTGLGETPVSGSVTKNQINYLYDGIVWQKGVSAIVGFNSFTWGLGIGFDQLLDRNRDVWIYELKPWLGLQLGIKLK